MNPQIILQGITIDQLADVIIAKLELNKVDHAIPQNDLLTREQSCALLSINKTSLWKHTKSGKLKSYGIGNRVFYKREELLQAVKPLNSK